MRFDDVLPRAKDRISRAFAAGACACAAIASSASPARAASAAAGARPSSKAQTASASGAFVEISRVGDATHLEFKGLESWRYDLRRERGADADVLVLRAPKLSGEAVAKLRALSDALVDSVRVVEDGLDEQSEIAIRLKARDVDSFDYLSESPSRLIVDLFPKEKPKASAEEPGVGDEGEERVEPKLAPVLPPKRAPAAPSGAKSTIANAAATRAAAGKAERKPAATEFIQSFAPEASSAEPSSSDARRAGRGATGGGASGGSLKAAGRYGLFDGADPTFRRFLVEDYEIREEAIIASRANVYLPFPMLRLERPQLKAMLSAPPIYEIVPEETDENREARLVQTLFERKRPALFLKTAKDFLRRYPESKYEEIVRYMIADQHFAFWQEDPSRADDYEAAISNYQTLAERHPDSPLAPRTQLLVGYLLLNRGDSMGALQAFQRFLRKNPESKAADSTRTSIAEAFLNVNRYDEARSQLDEVERSGATERARAEAAFRKGDVAFQKRDYEGALRDYRRAMNAYPAQERELPNASFNQAESAFWLARYKDAMNGFRDFLARHPDHPYGGFALARLGELAEILGAGKKRSAGAWMESGFRYRGAAGADVARTRLLTSRFPEMKEKELKDALREIAEIAKRSELPNYDEFVALLKADGLYGRGEYDRAASELIRFYQKNPHAPDLPKVKERIVRCLNEQIRDSVEKGDFIEGLRRWVEYSASWLKDSDRIDTQAYVGRAYESAGLFKEASATYRAALNKLYSIKGTEREKERGVFETLPTADSLNLRLAASSAAERDYARAQEHLKAIGEPEGLSEPERIERAQIAADVAEAKGQGDAARKSLEELVASWSGKPALVSPIYLRLAKREAASKEWKKASADVAKVLNLKADTELVPDDVHAGALELKGEIALARGRKAEAARAYRALLEEYEAKRPLASIRYKLGQIHFDLGEMKEAESAWGGLKGGSDDLWAKLAQEQMQSAKWQAEYSRYMRRIPAMADLRGEDGGAQEPSDAEERRPASAGPP